MKCTIVCILLSISKSRTKVIIMDSSALMTMPLVASYYNAGGVSDINSVMASAAGGGHEEIVRWCHDKGGATNVDKAMASAAGGGHKAIVRLCHDEWHATAVDWAMAKAAGRGHETIVRLCHDEWRASNVS